MKVFSFFIASVFMTCAFAHESCYVDSTSTPPFMVSDASGMGSKTYENFRSQDNYRNKKNIIPRRSIVKIRKGSEGFASHPNAYVPVEVVSTPDTYQLDEKLMKSRYRYSSGDAVRRKKVTRGVKGFLYSKSLKKADDYTYVVKENSSLLVDNGLYLNKKVLALKPQRSINGKYEILKCCKVFSFFNITENAESNCTTKYNFAPIFSDNSVGKTVALNLGECSSVGDLVPFKNKDINSILGVLKSGFKNDKNFSLANLELWDQKDLLKIPLDYNSYDCHGYKGPFGSYHYNTDDKGSSDVFAKPTTTCVFMKVLEEHQKTCKSDGCQVQFGNIWHPKSLGVHSTHGSGNCIDIRPLKKSSSKLTVHASSRNYDREKTKKMVDLFKKAGATKIIFDDYKLGTRGVSRSSDNSHRNHLHVCFDEKNKKVQQTCKNGIK